MSNLIRRDRDIESEIRDMVMSRLILSCGNDTRSEQEIVMIYNEIFTNYKRIPTFQLIGEEVEKFNSSVFYEAACMKYGYLYGDNFYPESANDIQEIADDIESDYKVSMVVNLDYFVDFILGKNKLACEIEPEDEVFHKDGMINVKHMRDVKTIAHDCQNVMFPDFIEDGVVGYGDYMNYYGIDNDEQTLFIGDGR